MLVSDELGLVERQGELTVERAGRWQAQRFGQVPEHLVELPHDREHLEHLLRRVRGQPPVLSAEGDLGDLLPRAEAVVHGATREALLPEAVVNAAAEVRLQMETGLPRVLVDREVRRGRERQCDTAQPEAALTVGSQADATIVGEGLRRFAFGQGAWTPLGSRAPLLGLLTSRFDGPP